jgi:hypothetical protein
MGNIEELYSSERFYSLGEYEINQLLVAAREREREQLYEASIPVALNTYIYAIAKGSKPENTKPDDFNPFRKIEQNNITQIDHDSIALELASQYLLELPPWVYEILSIQGIREPVKDAPGRSKCRIYGSRGLVLIDPIQLGEDWYCHLGFIHYDAAYYSGSTFTLWDWGEEDRISIEVPSQRVVELAGKGVAMFSGKL